MIISFLKKMQNTSSYKAPKIDHNKKSAQKSPLIN